MRTLPEWMSIPEGFSFIIVVSNAYLPARLRAL